MFVIVISCLLRVSLFSEMIRVSLLVGMILSVVRTVSVTGRLKRDFLPGRLVGDRPIAIWCDGTVIDSVLNVVCICLCVLSMVPLGRFMTANDGSFGEIVVRILISCVLTFLKVIEQVTVITCDLPCVLIGVDRSVKGLGKANGVRDGRVLDWFVWVCGVFGG